MTRSRPVIVMMGALVLAGCAGGTPQPTSSSLGGGQATNFSDDAIVRDKVLRVALRTGPGNVKIRTTRDGATTVHRDVRYTTDNPGVTVRSTAGTLTLEGCRGPAGAECFVHYEVVVPEGTEVTGSVGAGNVTLNEVARVDLEVESGHVSVAGVAGEVRARAGSGNVDLADVRGAVVVDSGRGHISGVRLGGQRTTASATAGNIRLALTRPQDVRVQTERGDAELTVPAGPYRVQVSGRPGASDIAVPHDPAARYQLSLHTSSGGIRVAAG